MPNPLKWKLKLTAELAPGESMEFDVTEWERAEEVTLGSLGLSLEESKTILAEIQRQMVVAQVECHGEARRICGHCGRRLPNKGHYQSTFRSAFGNVRVRVRRVTGCRACGNNLARPLFMRRSSTAPELRYLNAKLAALVPFGRTADLLNDVLPVATNAATVRNRTWRVGARLLRNQAQPAEHVRAMPAEMLVIGLDGGFVRSNRPICERNFEITAGKLLGADGECLRFAFATNEYERGLQQIRREMEELGVNEQTRITVCRTGMLGCGRCNEKWRPKRNIFWTGSTSGCVLSM